MLGTMVITILELKTWNSAIGTHRNEDGGLTTTA
jgi:hypothetical protein